jgi:hypothetical protein
LTDKPLHLVIIDSWVPEAVQRELDAGALPALAYLLSHGQSSWRCQSIFPSVTPVCLSSLLTGVGPDRHGVSGVLWYNPRVDRYVHYWPYPQSLLWGTVHQVVNDFFLNLNRDHLRDGVKTIFEWLESAGIDSACINCPISRGPFLHQAEIPFVLRQLGNLPRFLMLRGPRHLIHGDLVRGGSERAWWFQRYGFTDQHAATASIRCIQSHRPNFMLTYFNENDLRTHRHGPDGIGFSLRWVDHELARIMNAYGSFKAAVAQARWIITGDHSQSPTYPMRSGHAINVFELFDDHQICPLRQGGLDSGRFAYAVSPNDRMCYFHFNDGYAPTIAQSIRDTLTRLHAVDQICWNDGNWLHAYKRSNDGYLRFRPGQTAQDSFGKKWDWEGNLSVFDLQQVSDQLIDRDYPDALNRVTQALSVPNGARMLATAAAGHEFTSGFPMGRGNHGSLHAMDSLVPLVTVGLTEWSNPIRSTDILPLILQAFDIKQPAAGI